MTQFAQRLIYRQLGENLAKPNHLYYRWCHSTNLHSPLHMKRIRTLTHCVFFTLWFITHDFLPPLNTSGLSNLTIGFWRAARTRIFYSLIRQTGHLAPPFHTSQLAPPQDPYEVYLCDSVGCLPLWHRQRWSKTDRVQKASRAYVNCLFLPNSCVSLLPYIVYYILFT